MEPFALDGRSTNLADNPMAALFYGASSAICLPNSLSQEVGLGWAPRPFTRFHRAAETPINLIIQAWP